MTEQEQDAELLQLSKSLALIVAAQEKTLAVIEGVIFEIRALNAEIVKLHVASEIKVTLD